MTTPIEKISNDIQEYTKGASKFSFEGKCARFASMAEVYAWKRAEGCFGKYETTDHHCAGDAMSAAKHGGDEFLIGLCEDLQFQISAAARAA